MKLITLEKVMYDTFIIDLDGPLLNNKMRHFSCYRDIVSSNGYLPIDIDLYWELKKEKLNRHSLLKLSGAESTYDVFLTTWIEKIETIEYLKLDQLQERTKENLSLLKELKKKIIVITMRNNRTNLLSQLEDIGIIEYIDELISIPISQNALDKAFEAKKYINGNPIWIGDTEIDIKAAQSLNIETCAVTCGIRNSEYLLSMNPNFCEENLYKFLFNTLRIKV